MSQQTVPQEPEIASGSAKESTRIGLIAARGKDEARQLAISVANYLSAAGVDVVPEQMLGGLHQAPTDAIVVLGGDGLMMRAANAYPGVPLLGINFGNVGFLALVERRDWKSAIDALLAGRYTVQDGPTLKATLVRDEQTTPYGSAVNDVVVRSGIRMVDIEIYIDGRYVNTYPGDGMIVSTPHGSTAYCMAAGGPILTAGVRGFAIVPISCHSPIRTPFVVPEESVIELVVANNHESFLIIDGREQERLQRWDNVRVERGPESFRLVTLETTNFYEAFRTKFNFRIRPEAVPSRRGGAVAANSATVVTENGVPEFLSDAEKEATTNDARRVNRGQAG
jgi:NAD+ kinase